MLKVGMNRQLINRTKTATMLMITLIRITFSTPVDKKKLILSLPDDYLKSSININDQCIPLASPIYKPNFLSAFFALAFKRLSAFTALDLVRFPAFVALVFSILLILDPSFIFIKFSLPIDRINTQGFCQSALSDKVGLFILAVLNSGYRSVCNTGLFGKVALTHQCFFSSFFQIHKDIIPQCYKSNNRILTI